MRRCGLNLLKAVPVDAASCLLLRAAPKVEDLGGASDGEPLITVTSSTS